MVAADQLQLYKLVARQVAANMGMTACFLPKPVAGINGSGMHCNMSLSQKGKNIFYDAQGEDGLSKKGWDFVDRLLNSANDICLALNSSVNAYRRLDPHFEAPAWAVAWPCIHEFIAVVTNARIFKTPTPISIAFDTIKSWQQGSNLKFLSEGEGYMAVYKCLVSLRLYLKNTLSRFGIVNTICEVGCMGNTF